MNESTLADGRLTLGHLSRRPLPGLNLPSDFAFSYNGEYLYYLEPNEQGKKSLVCLDCQSLASSTLVAPSPDTQITRDEELRRERLRLTSEGVGSFQLLTSASRDLLLVNSGGRYRLIDPDRPDVPEHEFATSVKAFAASKDATVLATSTGDSIQVLDLSNGTEVVFQSASWKDRGPAFSVGVAEYVAQEELSRLEGIWLTYSGRSVLVAEVDEEVVPVTTLARIGQARPDLEDYRYPYAGGTNAKVGLSLISIASGEIVHLATVLDDANGGHDEEQYLVSVVATNDDNFVFATLNRSQKCLSWWRVDTTTASVTLLSSEEGEPWVNVPPQTIAISSGELLTVSERLDVAQIFKLGIDGTEEQITFDDGPVMKIIHHDQEQGVIYYLCASNLARDRIVRSLDLESRTSLDVVASDGWNDAIIAPGGPYMVFTHSSLDQSPSVSLRRRSGELIKELGTPVLSPRELGLQPPRLTTVMSEDGSELTMAVYFPPDRAALATDPNDPGKNKRPIIVSVYGGPHAQMVTNSWDMTVDLQAQLLAQCGAIVMKLDNRGSYARGRSFEATIHRSFGTIELDDQRKGVELVAKDFGGDLSRVGIYGWSYGGFMTLTAMAKAPDLFRAGVAGAPVVDFRYYDTAYTERYLGRPEVDPRPYDQANILQYLPTLTGDLLVIHGLIDENVHFHNTAHLVEELINLRRTPELVLLPNSRHAPRGEPYLALIAHRRTMHFVRAFSLTEPPL